MTERASTAGLRRLNFDITHLFVAPIPHQAAALGDLLRDEHFDAVIADASFFGILPFLLGERSARPPVLAFTPMPLMVSSRDTATPGLGLPPAAGARGRLRNRALNTLSHKAVHPLPTLGFRLPPWWDRLDGERPVVHVTQGTVDNADLSRLLEPAIEALGGEDITVVATTGGRDITEVNVPLPLNTLVAEYIPHDLLLSKVDVMVTNGGYGAVQRALATGVPLVVAGDTEDKPEVAARVAWSGAGINLRTGTPTPRALRRAVRQVLDRPQYTKRAKELEAAFAQRDGASEIAALIDEVIAEHRPALR